MFHLREEFNTRTVGTAFFCQSRSALTKYDIVKTADADIRRLGPVDLESEKLE
jgi:hypothetical protein